ncbi:MAG: RNA methyltransferase [Polaribacter sp.]|nr:RNA methyltransferase [Polaribacter sp.]
MNLSNNHIKLITSLQQKKYRQKHKLFVAEGVKVVKELLNSSFVLEQLFVTNDCAIDVASDQKIEVTSAELKKISQLKTPNKVLGLFQIPEKTALTSKGITVALDAVNDPGNLGTIIRLCDWFGVSQLVCSSNTVDCFNQKVVQASMGSLTRVAVVYIDLFPFLQETKLPVFAADMGGANVYKVTLPKEAVLIMGNEANGISDEIRNLVQQKISIPRFGNEQKTESLNVATATAILLSEFKRA